MTGISVNQIISGKIVPMAHEVSGIFQIYVHVEQFLHLITVISTPVELLEYGLPG